MPAQKKILWLVSWYPNKYDSFDGDFIQRHAKAAALSHRVHVLFIKQSAEQKSIEVEMIDAAKGNYSEQMVYLPLRTGTLGKVLNYRKWMSVYKRQVELIVRREKPDLIHVNIPWKVGLIALWAKKRFKLPYVVTEHWGIYNNVVEDNIHRRSPLVRRLLKRIYTEASAFVSVSKFLGDAVNQTLVRKNFSVIPNVVDTGLFCKSEDKDERFTFLHVSNMVPLKNVEGILKAFQIFLQQNRASAQLVLVGNKDDHYVLQAQELGLLRKHICFKGEVAYSEVAKHMQRSHVLVLNSNIENSPCVIGEALCCGLPVIATNVGGIPELVNEKNGLLVQPQNPTDLAQAMVKIYQNYSGYNPAKIEAAAVRKFSVEATAKAFSDLYEAMMASQKEL